MKKSKIVLATYCPYCQRALKLLNEKGFQSEIIDVTNDKAKWEAYETLTGQSTVPYIFIDEKFIGGCDELMALDRSGQLTVD